MGKQPTKVKDYFKQQRENKRAKKKSVSVYSEERREQDIKRNKERNALDRNRNRDAIYSLTPEQQTQQVLAMQRAIRKK
jgi:hypothetical protein